MRNNYSEFRGKTYSTNGALKTSSGKVFKHMLNFKHMSGKSGISTQKSGIWFSNMLNQYLKLSY